MATILSDRAPGGAAVWYATMRSQTRCNIGFDVPNTCASVRRGALYQIEAANALGCRRVYAAQRKPRKLGHSFPNRLDIVDVLDEAHRQGRPNNVRRLERILVLALEHAGQPAPPAEQRVQAAAQ